MSYTHSSRCLVLQALRFKYPHNWSSIFRLFCPDNHTLNLFLISSEFSRPPSHPHSTHVFCSSASGFLPFRLCITIHARLVLLSSPFHPQKTAPTPILTSLPLVQAPVTSRCDACVLLVPFSVSCPLVFVQLWFSFVSSSSSQSPVRT